MFSSRLYNYILDLQLGKIVTVLQSVCKIHFSLTRFAPFADSNEEIWNINKLCIFYSGPLCSMPFYPSPVQGVVKFLSISQHTAVEFYKRSNIQIKIKVHSHNSKKKKLWMKIQTVLKKTIPLYLQNILTVPLYLQNVLTHRYESRVSLISQCTSAEVENFWHRLYWVRLS